jgi:glycosyltransferase involved in cell wall biosynthesis
MIISFVIPVFNSTFFLFETLNSIMKCAENGDEIIVVDDGSSLTEKSKLRNIISNFEGVSVINHASNLGAFQSRKSGVVASKGDYVIFVDSDDWIIVDNLALVKRDLRDKPADILLYQVRNFSEDGVLLSDQPYFPADCQDLVAVIKTPTFHLGTPGKFYSRSVLIQAYERIGDIGKLSYGEDALIFSFGLNLAGSVRVLKNISYGYRASSFGISRQISLQSVERKIHDLRSCLSTIYEKGFPSNFDAEIARKLRVDLLKLETFSSNINLKNFWRTLIGIFRIRPPLRSAVSIIVILFRR